MSERLYTKHDVSEIVRRRIAGLNERIAELELELIISQFNNEIQREMTEYGRTNND